MYFIQKPAKECLQDMTQRWLDSQLTQLAPTYYLVWHFFPLFYFEKWTGKQWSILGSKLIEIDDWCTCSIGHLQLDWIKHNHSFMKVWCCFGMWISWCVCVTLHTFGLSLHPSLRRRIEESSSKQSKPTLFPFIEYLMLTLRKKYIGCTLLLISQVVIVLKCHWPG